MVMKIIDWQDSYDFWKMRAYNIAPELLRAPSFQHIKFKFDNSRHRIFGYDWLHKNEYEQRIKLVTKDPTSFLLFGESLNKGTLQTAEYLVKAGDDPELLALIWIYSIIRDLSNNLPESLRGDGKRLLSGIEFGLYPKLKENNMQWHHSMRKLLPEEYFSYVYDDLELDGINSIIELAIINAKLIYNNYTIVLYDSFQSKG